MSFYNSDSYYFKSDQQPSSSKRNVFDATKSNDRYENVPEIGSTIYNTVPTDSDIFVYGLFDNKQTEAEIYPIRETGLTAAQLKSSRIFKNMVHRSKSSDQSLVSRNRSDYSISQRKREPKMKTVITSQHEDEEADDEYSTFNDFSVRNQCGYYPKNMPRNARNQQSRPLYDGTDSGRDYSSFSLRNREISRQVKAPRMGIDIPGTRMVQSSRLRSYKAVLASDELPRCFLKLPISVITEQRIRVTTTVRQIWLHSTIYIFSAQRFGSCNIEQLESLLKGAPIINRKVKETEWDKRPLSLKEEIFVKNNIIKIKKSAILCDLNDRKQVTINDHRIYSNLCPADITNAALHEVHSDVPMRPSSKLNIAFVREQNRFINGNIRLNEKMIIYMSDDNEPQTNCPLQNKIEEKIVKPKNYDIPVQYTEEVRVGQRRIDINRETEINPPNGLIEFMTIGQPELFEFGEIRRYGEIATSSDKQLSRAEKATQSQFSDSHRLQSAEIVDKQLKDELVAGGQLKEQTSLQKIQPENISEVKIVEGLDISGIPIISSSIESSVDSKQKLISSNEKQSKKDLRLKKARLFRRDARRSSRWSRFALTESQKGLASSETRKNLPAAFNPLETSTPIKKSPSIIKDESDQKKLSTEEYIKTSTSQSSGTGTHIRSTLDCDITLSTTKKATVTEIPIEIKGFLNGLPWRTTIRLRIKHDVNEKPTFKPNQLSLNNNILWQNHQLLSDQSNDK